MDDAAQTCAYDGDTYGAGVVSLVEEGEDFVALFELLDARTDCFDGACSVGTGDDVIFGGKRIFALW